MRRVVVVDDDDFVRAMIVIMLRRAGYHVAEASSGEQGIRLLQSFSPDVVITDVSMPNQQAIDLLSQLRASPGPRPRVLIIAGGSPRVRGTDYLQLAGLLGADASIPKPFTLQALVDAIEGSGAGEAAHGGPAQGPGEMAEQARQVNALFERLAESQSWEAVRRDAELSSLVADAIYSVENASRSLRAYGQALADRHDDIKDFIASFGAFGEAWMDFLRTLLPERSPPREDADPAESN